MLFPIFLALGVAEAQRVVHADLWKDSILNITSLLHILDRRQLSQQVAQDKSHSLYSINIEVGSPPQKQTLQLDTGSRALWVPATGSQVCGSGGVPCDDLGSFDPSQSSTFVDSNRQTTIGYADGTGISGDFFLDTVTIGGTTVSRQLSVLATQGQDIYQGILGVGFPADYPTLNHNLAAQGKIASNSYTLSLDSIDSPTGTILFGGIDTSKFSSPLTKLPIIPDTSFSGAQTFTGANLRLQSVTTQTDAQPPQTISADPQIVNLDSGTTLTSLPEPLITSILTQVNATYYPFGSTSGVTVIPCAQAALDFRITYTFDGAATIAVPMRELILGHAGTRRGVDYCQFGLYGTSSDDDLPNLLGDTFLRSAVVVYHLDAKQIGIAQAEPRAEGGSVVEIPEDGIPDV